MDSRTNDFPKLIEFNKADYFETGVDNTYKDGLPYVELKQKGIDLVSEYYSHKYYVEKPIKTANIVQVIEKIKSEDFSRIRSANDDVRIPFMITGTHSTPVVYMKEQGHEYLLIFDSLGDTSMAKNAAVALPEIDIYTSINKIRQRDSYSCHAEALVFLRELTGKDKNHKFLIPDITHELIKNVVQNINKDDNPHNLHEIKLFGSLLITIQNPPFMDEHEEQYKSEKIIHTHKDNPEQIKIFLERYPPEERVSIVKRPNVSSYLREKGLKFSHIIEIQFYLNQLKNFLGNQFTEKLQTDFMTDAKNIIKTNRNSFLTEGRQKNLYDLSQKYLEKNLNLSEDKNTDQITYSINKAHKD